MARAQSAPSRRVRQLPRRHSPWSTTRTTRFFGEGYKRRRRAREEVLVVTKTVKTSRLMSTATSHPPVEERGREGRWVKGAG